MRVTVVLGVLVAAIVVLALSFGGSGVGPPLDPGRPPGPEPGQTEPGQTDPGHSIDTGSSNGGDGTGEREILGGSAPEPTARFCGRILFGGQPRQVVGTIDRKHELEIDEHSGWFESPLLAAGEHELLGFVMVENRVDVIETRLTLAKGERRNLGELIPAPTEPAALRIKPGHAATGAAFDLAEVLKSALSRRRADLGVAGLKIFVPIGRDLAVRGLPRDGLAFVIAGAPPTVRLEARTLRLQREFDVVQLRPGMSVTMAIEYAKQAPLSVVVRWPSNEQLAQEPTPAEQLSVKISLVNLQSSFERSTRCKSSGVGVGRSRIIAEVGRHLIRASLVRSDDVVIGFAAQTLVLEQGGREVELHCRRVWRAHGRVANARTGESVEISLAACPDKVLWKTKAGTGGSFALDGVPADQSLVMSVAGGAFQRVRSELRGERLQLVLVPR